MGTHYDTLGVARTASTTEIRKAYLRRARALHPDRQQGRSKAVIAQTEDAMRQVNIAWDVLSNAEKKAAYDRKLLPSKPASRTPPRQASSSSQPQSRTSASHGAASRQQPRQRSIDEVDGDGSVSAWASLPVLLLLGLLLGVLVVTAFSGGEPTENRPVVPTAVRSLAVDSCFELVGNDTPRERSCFSPSATGKVVSVVPSRGNCPTGMDAIDDPSSDFFLCWVAIVPGSEVTIPPG